MTEDKELRQTIKEISYGIVDQIAPEEIEVFDEVSDAYFSNPDLLSGKNSKDDPIGFGIEGIVDMVSPATITVVTTVITYIVTEAFGAAKGALTEELKNKIKALFNKSNKNNKNSEGDGKDVPQLTKEQLGEVRARALSQAKAMHLSDEQSTNLANALISSMVLQT